MSAPAVESRFSLRDLPFPVKLVITCFLLSVGLGYTTAMVQLHFQDSKSGEALPLEEDVVLKFTGKRYLTEAPPKPVSKFTQLISSSSGTFGSNGTMLPAFFEKDPSFNKALRAAPADETKLRGEREGERDALVAWANAPKEERKKAYEEDTFNIAPDKMPKAITTKYREGNNVKVKTIIEVRCVSCHGKGQPQEGFPLETYDQIDKYLAVPEQAPFKPGWNKVEEPMSLEKLTQSTHAHLLSFAVLFSLTGLVFAFTSYPVVIRCLISPLVLLAIVTDVSFWWLARLSEGYGVFFAKGVMVTGGTAGLGLGLQITVSLWNMYGPKGKAVIVLLFAAGGAIGGLVMKEVVMPGLKAKKEETEAKLKAEGLKKVEVKAEIKVPPEKKSEDKKPEDKKEVKKTEEKKPEDKKSTETPMPRIVGEASVMDRALLFPVKDDNGKEVPLLELPFDKGDKKNMVRAFFDKDAGDFAEAVKKKNVAEQGKLAPERHGELAALKAWLRLPEDERKKAFDADAFELPADLAKKPITPDYLKNGKVTIKSMVGDRCVRCHDSTDKTVFTDYETLRPFLEPHPPGK